MASRRVVRRGARDVSAGVGPARPTPKIYKTAKPLLTFRIFSYPVQVFKADELASPNSQGEFFVDEHEIYLLDESPSAAADADRLVHETLHAISQIALASDDRLSERQVNTVSMALVDILVRNPGYRSYLLGLIRDSSEARPVPDEHAPVRSAESQTPPSDTGDTPMP